MLIKDILTIDLSEDIKEVIDLEDVSEAEIQSEIENYIITDGLARHYEDFAGRFTSNIKETGVWISGFYGSGKSYFGKLMGYLLSNQTINGTPARERMLQRFTGINNEELIKNSISRLEIVNCRVVFLDVAKQDTSKGLAFTLFRNFLKSLELPENEHGYFLFQLLITDKQRDIHQYIRHHLGRNWADIRTKMFEYSKAIKEIFIRKGNSEADYQNLFTSVCRDIDQFSAARFRDELINYFEVVKDEKVVFIFDEASEALNQNKYSLTDLEGISEALSDSKLNNLTWTIAIAQEKLDDVINNSKIDKAQLTKVTDRFKTKIHLEATEVDVIIRSRLLTKTPTAKKLLQDYFDQNSGKISDHASLVANGITKTNSSDTFVTYYPFFKHHFDLLQNFLFGTKGYATTKVAARGMISTTYDVLKKQSQSSKLYEMATAWQIAREAQTSPPVRLVNRYDSAEKILKDSQVSGRHLLETINFLSQAEVVPVTLPNIIRSYVKEPEDYHKVKDHIAKALDLLVEARIILAANNTYRITSDIEQRMLDEMVGFSVQGYVKKKEIVNTYKSLNILKSLARLTDSSLQYDFYITTDNDDEISAPNLKHLKIKVKSVYNISENRGSDIDSIKTQFQNNKDVIWLVPDNDNFREIDKLTEDIKRIEYLEQKYPNPQSDEGAILRDFTNAKNDKEERLKELIEQSLQSGTAIYLFNTYDLTSANWQVTLQDLQRQSIKNVYSKRLGSQLSDTIATIVIKEANGAKLSQYFHGLDFQFFDSNGNFTTANLKVVDEIEQKIRNTFVDGKTIEKELEQPPTGFSFGTVITTLAAMVRGGQVMVKHGGNDYFSWQDTGVAEVFTVAAKFRNASFKIIADRFSSLEKNEIVEALKGMKCDDHLSTKEYKKKIDWNTNDFDLVNAVRELAKHFCDKVETMKKQNKEFDTLFPGIEQQKDFLSGFTGAVSDANYLSKGRYFLEQKQEFTEAVKEIEATESFIRNKLPFVKKWKEFMTGVKDEITKASADNDSISLKIEQFNSLYSDNIAKNYSKLQETAQSIKDDYYILMSGAAGLMSSKYLQLKEEADKLATKILEMPEALKALNKDTLSKVTSLSNYAGHRTKSSVSIEYDVKDKTTRFTWSEMLSFIELYPTKQAELNNLSSGLVMTMPDSNIPPSPVIKTIATRLPGRRVKVSQYRSWLQAEIQKIAGASENDEVEIS